MMNLENLRELANKNQTRIENIIREYFQHLFLSTLYRIKGSEKLIFKGGTALRIIYGSPRFSEDLDFTGYNIHQTKIIDDLFLEVTSEIEKTGLDVELKEAKPTTGGYLGIINYRLYDVVEDVKFEISLRRSKISRYEVSTIINDFLPAYTIVHLSPVDIVRGKTDALLDRAKPRDFYDFYFILRHPELRKFTDNNLYKKVKDKLAKKQINFKSELSVLLPASHSLILKDFKNTLIKEIEKYS